MENREQRKKRSPERAIINSDGRYRLYWEENIALCPVRDSMSVENEVYFHRRPSRQGRNV
ncbi:MAG: hypothetical protein LBG15_06200 [Dysgonamonadaceae bacterium]|nr:hypothetical protein [Dysgonamonadaceae bacterium]